MKTFNVILLFSTIFLVSCQTCSNCSYCEQSKLQTSVLLANCVKNLPITVANEEWKACEIEEPNTCHEELIVLTKMLAKCMGKKCVQVWHLSLLSRPLVNQLLLRPPHSTPQRKPQPLLSLPLLILQRRFLLLLIHGPSSPTPASISGSSRCP
ncbi:hypothetical protein L596_012676 [Steinernema carpocapsae]|uniref:Saposin B-type domain-containing protein n=1 Tax=Steinernema carpocapsae TaxID=34508 RepID=A0A4U5NYP5_STECR|nr:hypothetical protein L596_012676 [Steinernema carpocapsae]